MGGVAGGTMAATWGHCLALLRHMMANLSSPHFPPPCVLLSYCPLLRLVSCFFCLVACMRPHVPLCPSVGWLVRRTAFFGPFHSCWVFLGHIGSYWVILGRFGSGWVVLVIWVSHATYRRF